MENLEKLTQTKLQKQVSYLRAELEETFVIFQKSCIAFTEEFGTFNSSKATSKAPSKNRIDTRSPLPTFDIPKTAVKRLFKRISQKIHPDKLASKDLSKSKRNLYSLLYTQARTSVDNNDWVTLVSVLGDLDMKTRSKSENEYLEITIIGLDKRIKEIKTTLAWKWEFCDKSDKLRKGVEEQLEKAEAL
jgi:hypothetical protein